MIQRLRDNPCIEGASNPLGRRKRAWASLNAKQWLLFFSISGGLSILIRCLKVRLSIRYIIKMFWRPSVNVCDEGDQTRGIMSHGFLITRTRQHTTRCEEVFCEKQHSSDGTSNVISGPSTVRLFSLRENKVCTQRNQVRVRGCSERKSDATLEQLNTKLPASLLPTVENLHGAV